MKIVAIIINLGETFVRSNGTAEVLLGHRRVLRCSNTNKCAFGENRLPGEIYPLRDFTLIKCILLRSLRPCCAKNIAYSTANISRERNRERRSRQTEKPYFQVPAHILSASLSAIALSLSPSPSPSLSLSASCAARTAALIISVYLMRRGLHRCFCRGG